MSTMTPYVNPGKVWKKGELEFIKLVKEHPVLYSWKHIPSKTPIMKIWKSIAEATNMSTYECKSKWECWKKIYVLLRKQELEGHKTISKFLDGALKFLDDECGELRQIRNKKTVTVLSISTIDQLLKERHEDPDIDSATLQYLYNILTNRIEKVMKSSLNVERSAKRAKVANISENSKIEETAQIAKPLEIEPTPQANIAKQVESNGSDNIKQRKLIIKQPDEINMDAIISDIASQTLESTNSQNRKTNELECRESSILFNEVSENEMENQTIDLEKDETERMECLSSTNSLSNNTQSQVVESNKSAEKVEIDTVFDLHCSRKDPRLFFRDLAEYIIEKFSREKQQEIRLKICSVVTEAELEEME